MKHKLLFDISTIYSIRISILNKLSDLVEICICDYLLEAKLQDEDLVEINIGFGKILILLTSDAVEYQFIPSSKLEKLIKNTLFTNKSPLEKNLEIGLENKLVSTYKELF